MAARVLGHLDYYVYILFRRDTGEPFYVGFGRRRRWLVHEQDARRPVRQRDKNTHKRHIILIMLNAGLDVPKIKVAENLSFEQAKEIERSFVAAIGRWPNGPLTNKTDGGDGGKLDEQARQKIAAARRGTSLSEEHRQNISLGLQRADRDGWARAAEWRRGRKQNRTEDGNRRVREAQEKWRAENPEKARQRQMIATNAAALANRGRPRTVPPEHMARMRALALAKIKADQERFLLSLPIKEIDFLRGQGWGHRPLAEMLGLTNRVMAAAIRRLIERGLLVEPLRQLGKRPTKS